MPSGAPLVVNLRRNLRSIIGYEVPEPGVIAVELCIINIDVVERPWPLDAIYVGHGPLGSGLNPSPWGSPFAIGNTCERSTAFIGYARQRADARLWLLPLLNKRLLCHCENECHAHDLEQVIQDVFGEKPIVQTAPRVPHQIVYVKLLMVSSLSIPTWLILPLVIISRGIALVESL